MIYKYKTKSYNPYHNLALENFFLDFAEKNNSFILYFWQNQDTVVIGRNQEADVECDLVKMKEKKILLLRRETGGGAVYHDKNNLNFSFIVPKKVYDKEKSMNIIKKALQNLGFKADISGRNDILVNDKKVSGNAYYKNKNVILHHGTVLIDTNFRKMEDILTPDISKLNSKKVKSVKSRVLNLKELKDISTKELEKEIEKEFLKCYNKKNFETFKIKNYKNKIIKRKKLYMSEDWLYNKDFNSAPIILKKRIESGLYTIKKNKDGEYKIFSDSLDLNKIKKIQEMLNGQLKNCPSDRFVVQKILSVMD